MTLALAVLLLALAAFAVVTWARRHAETPRRPVRDEPAVTFQARVRVKASFLGQMLPLRGSLELTVRGDGFRVAHRFAVDRWLAGQGWSYRAGDVTIEMVPGLLHYWIEITGPTRAVARIQIGSRDQNRRIWYALVGAGARPIGSPPPP